MFHSFNNDFYVRAYVYNSSGEYLTGDDDNEENNNFVISLNMNEGEIYYFNTCPYRIENYGKYSVSIKKVAAAESIKIGDAEEVIAYVGSNYYIYADYYPGFSHVKSLEWESSNEEIVSLNSCDDSAEIFCNKVGTVIITAKSDDGLEDTLKITVQEPKNINLDEEINLVLDTENIGESYRFTPKEDGHYRFRVSAPPEEYYDTKVNIFETSIYNSLGSENGYNYNISVYLKSGVTYTVAVNNYSSKVDYAQISVELNKVEEITLENPFEVVTTEPNKDAVMYFVPKESKNYRIYYYGMDFDNSAEFMLFDSDRNLLAEDYSGTYLEYDFEARKVYYIYTNCTAIYGEFGPYTVALMETVAPESISIYPTEIKGYQGEYININCAFYPENSRSESIEWFIADETVASLHYDSVYLNASGTTTLTATSQSKITDTVAITVYEPEQLEIDVQKTLTFGSEISTVVYEFTPQKTSEYCFKFWAETYFENFYKKIHRMAKNLNALMITTRICMCILAQIKLTVL